MNPKRIKVEFRDQIAVVSLNRPDKLNAFDTEMFFSISKCIKKLKRNRDIRVVILRGEGKDFSTGLDIKNVMNSTTAALYIFFKWWPFAANIAQHVSWGWRQIPVPVIAVIHGRCWGAGMQVALGADFRIATPDSQLSIMESKWGLIPDMAGSIGLREIMPYDQAARLTMTSEIVTGKNALELGLVSEIHEDPFERSLGLAEELKQRSPDAISGIKKLYHKAWHRNDRYLLFKEWAYQIKILFGKNRGIAVKKQLGKDVDYQRRASW